MEEDVVVETRTSARFSVAMLIATGVVISLVVLFASAEGFDRPQVITCIDNVDKTPPGLNDPEEHGPDYKPAVVVKVETERKHGRFAKRRFLGCTFYWYNHAPFR